MEVDELLRVFNAGYSLQEFLTFLGRDCLDNLDSLRIEQYGEWSDLHINVRDEVALASRELWAPDGSFLAGPGLRVPAMPACDQQVKPDVYYAERRTESSAGRRGKLMAAVSKGHEVLTSGSRGLARWQP